MNPETTPVIVGVGQVNDRNPDAMTAMDSFELMVAALKEADADAGGGWLADLDSIAQVDQISFGDFGDVTGRIAKAVGAKPSIAYKTDHASGDSPILLLNEAANRIGAGEIRIAAVIGAEALRTAARRAAMAAGTDEQAQNAMRKVSAAHTKGLRQRYDLVAPVDMYPLYENAGRAAYGQTLAEAQAESGAIWSRFSHVANDSKGAWIKRPTEPEGVTTPSADNRPIAFPYTKLMVANSSVNQGAGFIVTSLAEARRRGVDETRLVYVGMGAAAHEPYDPLGRDRYTRSKGMEVSISKTMELNKVTTDDLDHVELYSCFPCVPKMARRVLGWPVDRDATVFGGLTFGGAAVGNYMSHAVAAMVDKLRETGGKGLLFANGGIATHNHTILVSSDPIEAAHFPQDFDYNEEAERLREPVPELAETYTGPAEIETYTVFYNRDSSPRNGTIVARTPDGKRTVATVAGDDEKTIAFLTDGQQEPVGSKGNIALRDDGMQVWQIA